MIQTLIIHGMFLRCKYVAGSIIVRIIPHCVTMQRLEIS